MCCLSCSVWAALEEETTHEHIISCSVLCRIFFFRKTTQDSSRMYIFCVFAKLRPDPGKARWRGKTPLNLHEGEGLKDGMGWKEGKSRLLCFWKLHHVGSSITFSEIWGGDQLSATKLTGCCADWSHGCVTWLLPFICVNKFLRQSWARIQMA